MSGKEINRRSFLGGAGALAAGIMVNSGAAAKAAQNSSEASKQTFRICHLTDIHITPHRDAPETFEKAIKRINSLTPKPSLIVTGGDNIMDSFATPEKQVKRQYELLDELMAKTDIPVKYCLGNHDLWGWNKSKSKTTGEEAKWGAKWAIEHYGLPGEYYSFNHSGWKFIMLNTVKPDPNDKNGYIGGIGEKQFAWLENVLAGMPSDMPAAIISHIPLLTVTNFELLDSGANLPRINPGWICYDGPKAAKLFKRHKNVKLCLSGHMHRRDRIDYMGVSYICDGAVSGGWWRGPHRGCEAGFGLLDLNSEGSFNHEYIEYL
ncbi:metallophosphoesterase family protein [Sedimentisphaera salicampi]|uniref:metallophosphoesterase family protein n=1 Tax=Sedimentisphaera salicampi TaxID=1941349 RepID=UPI000B9A6FE8|nr:metallophosphoesterase [Sedimentisphaera salicampi]OXU14480.1 3',5'-cyclic adenosine monophosphate phosphodiesterase CpdA [Sedimentisphaera salicampi]